MTTRTRQLILGYFLSNKVTGEPCLYGSIDLPTVIRMFSTAEKAELFNTKNLNKYIVKPCFELITEVIEEASESKNQEDIKPFYEIIHNSGRISASSWFPYTKYGSYNEAREACSKYTNPLAFHIEYSLNRGYFTVYHSDTGFRHDSSLIFYSRTEAENYRKSLDLHKSYQVNYHYERCTPFIVVETATDMPCVDNYRITLKFPSREAAEIYRKSLDLPTNYEVRSMYV